MRHSDWYWASLWTDLMIKQVMMYSLTTRGGIARGGGMRDAVRLAWVGSMHRRAGIHEAMTTLTNMKRNASQQHVKLTLSWWQRDMEWMEKINLWLHTHNPCNLTTEALQSLSAGLTASDGDNIDCENTKNAGLQMQRILDWVYLKEVLTKINNHWYTFKKV